MQDRCKIIEECLSVSWLWFATPPETQAYTFASPYSESSIPSFKSDSSEDIWSFNLAAHSLGHFKKPTYSTMQQEPYGNIFYVRRPPEKKEQLQKTPHRAPICLRNVEQGLSKNVRRHIGNARAKTCRSAIGPWDRVRSRSPNKGQKLRKMDSRRMAEAAHTSYQEMGNESLVWALEGWRRPCMPQTENIRKQWE
ncbi:hypothetical protein OBBRIDRAFT_807611 [Obba rivulosa]|uniref:Uncharacterized protein n=1 Tax=Obba rivulosa TaxID=1052685 RepID=A0A8E2AN73_9APHY|nr:hypothetical protein OBBRIDRAFT_807611 [Obba rivulosa]